VLYIEAALLPRGKDLTITGQFGEVMQESAKTARSYLWSHAARFGLEASEVSSNIVPYFLDQILFRSEKIARRLPPVRQWGIESGAEFGELGTSGQQAQTLGKFVQGADRPPQEVVATVFADVLALAVLGRGV
jgi:Lon protease (S16) C-terminal proteolytic domain